jgi:uncharacterized protein
MKKVLIVSFLVCAFFPFFVSALEVPDYYNYVNDFANVIDDRVENELNQKISNFESSTTNEIAVVTINSLEGENLEDFSMKLAEKWKVGKEDKDNGIILLFAVQEKKVRLEVGYGLEGVINDAKAGRILDDYVVSFRNEGNYTKAAESGVDGIILVLGTDVWSEKQKSVDINAGVLLLIIFCFIGVFGLVLFFVEGGSSSYGSFGGGSSSGSASGGGSFGGSSFGGFGGGGFGGGGASR